MELFYKILFSKMERVENKGVVGRLAELRRDSRARSVRAFALSISADPSFYAKIEKGDKELTDGIAEGICKKYGVNKDWLFTGQGPKKAEPSPAASQTSKEIEIMERMITMLEADKLWLQGMMKTSLAAILGDVKTLADRQKGIGTVILQALEDIGEKDRGSLVGAADKLIRQKIRRSQKRDSKAVQGSSSMETSSDK
jgi:hypothetical protein